MIVGVENIQRRIVEENLIDNLGDRDLNNPEGVGRDLRLGKIFIQTGGGAFIECDGEAGLGLRKGIGISPLASFDPNSEKQEVVGIIPGEYYLVQTVEKINTPADLMPEVFPRTSLFRAGLGLFHSKTDPGYCGELTFGLVNMSRFPVELQMGARICNIVFHQIDGTTITYRGQHQGRVTPTETERQV